MTEELKVRITLDDEASAGMKGFGDVLGGLGNIAGGVVLGGLTALGAGLAISVNEAMEAQTVQAQLEAVLKSTGGTAGVTADLANDLATSLSSVTRFSDEAILTGENMLLTFTNIGKDVFPAATQAILDMSTATGQDLQSSAVQLGKALNDPIAGISALTRVGVTFTEEQKKQIETMVEAGDVAGAQQVILAELAREFGGAAEAAGTTFAGQMDILKNSLLNTAEGIGAQLLPLLTPLLGDLLQLAQEALPPLVDIIKEWSAEMQVTLGPALTLIGDSLGRMGKALGIREEVTLLDVGMGALRGTLDAVVAGVQLAAIVIDGLAGAVEAVRNFVNDASAGWNSFRDSVRGAVDAIPDWLRPGSPTPFEMGLRGIADAMSGLDQAPPRGLASAQPAALATGAASLTIGTVNLASGMDLAEFRALLRDALGG